MAQPGMPRGEADRQAIGDSMSVDTEVGEVKFSSPYVYKFEGVPQEPALIEAINDWANVWGNEIVPTMKDEGLYDSEDPVQVEAMGHLEVAAGKISELLPTANFLVGEVRFEDGYVQLSSN